MFAIKAARDKLNQGSGSKLALIFTGSHRDKLAHLVLKKEQPFFGSQITPFPMLGRPFTDAYTGRVNKQLASKNRFTEDDMFTAFELVGYRPEMLKSLVKDIALDFGSARDFGNMLKHGAPKIRDQIWAEIASEYAGLPAIQKAVLQVIVQQNQIFSPFNEDAMSAYRKVLGSANINSQNIQAALEGLRQKNLIWKSGRGTYAIEDASIAHWFETKKKQAYSDQKVIKSTRYNRPKNNL